jgi:hypothetical protein
VVTTANSTIDMIAESSDNCCLAITLLQALGWASSGCGMPVRHEGFRPAC